MNPFVILLWGRDALLARETLTCIWLVYDEAQKAETVLSAVSYICI